MRPVDIAVGVHAGGVAQNMATALAALHRAYLHQFEMVLALGDDAHTVKSTALRIEPWPPRFYCALKSTWRHEQGDRWWASGSEHMGRWSRCVQQRFFYVLWATGDRWSAAPALTWPLLLARKQDGGVLSRY